MPSIIERICNRLFTGLARKKDLDRLYDQIAGLMEIHAALQGKPVLRRMRGWAISPDAMLWMLNDLQLRSQPFVVEFGCGQSTIIFASMLKLRTGGRLLSVEHDRAYAKGMQQQLDAMNLGDVVEFVFCPIVDVPGSTAGLPEKSYDLGSMRELAVDLCLVDGPPVAFGEGARYQPAKWALSHLKPGGTAYLDDTDRTGERKIIEVLKREFPGMASAELDTEKGLTRFLR